MMITTKVDATFIFLKKMDEEEFIHQGQMNTLSGLIDLLSNEERIELRIRAKEAGIFALPQNLFYNYDTQTWIEDKDFSLKPLGRSNPCKWH